LDFEIGGREAKTFDKLFRRLEKQYKITKYYTDNYPVYGELIPHKIHQTGKRYTQQTENLNGRIRHYIKGFNRKTKGYFKTIKMAENVLKLFFWGDINY
jgi:IS1 family transposase